MPAAPTGMNAPSPLPWRVGLAFVLGLAAAVLLYWPGLSGPFLLDDYATLTPVSRWHSGLQGWLLTMLPNPHSVLDSRPVSMLSFMLSTWAGDGSVFSIKLGNLVLHLCCGALGFMLLRRLLLSAEGTAAHANWGAALLALVWLVHPLQVSTVLYMAQRMAELSAMFSLAAVLAYLVARRQLARGSNRLACFNLFVTVTCLVAIGAFSKQNAVVAPLLCLVLELAYFKSPARMPAPVRWFHGLFVLAPCVGAALLLAVAPEKVLDGYAAWDFTLQDRLLTQPRVLFDYIHMWFVPYSPGMGLYSDDFAISTSLASPWTTLPSILGLAGISLLAIRFRARAPHVFAGWFFFLVAHAVESTILPLEMHYEHRNYLPSFGLLLAAAGLVAAIARSRYAMRSSARIRVAAAVGLLAILSFATYGRVLLWQTEQGILVQATTQHPNSLRAHVDLSAVRIREHDYGAAAATMRQLADSPDIRNRFVARMDLLTIGCMAGYPPDIASMDRTVAMAPRTITVAEVHVALLQDAAIRDGRCPASTAPVMAHSMSRMLEHAIGQADAVPTKMTVRRLAAGLYALTGDGAAALHHAETGWRARKTMPMGALLARLYIQSAQWDEAEGVIASMKAMTRPFDNLWLADIARIERQFRTARSRLAPSGSARSESTSTGAPAP